MATKLQSPTPAKGVQFQLNANTFWRTGYTFNGWTTNYTSSISDFSDNAYVTFDGDRDLYALWKANNYQVRFNANGGTGAMGNQTFTYDQGQYLAANAFIRTAYDFNRWTTGADGSGNQYGNGVWVSNLTATPGGIVDLYAQWTPKQYTATFYHNDGTGGYTQKTQAYGSALYAPSIVREGYKLLGWSPEIPATVPPNDSSYTAQWQLMPETSGTFSFGNTSVTVTGTTPAGATVYTSLASATSGYDGGTTSIPKTQNVSFSSDTTIYVWFRITAPDYRSSTYRAGLTRTTTSSGGYTWGSWTEYGHGDKNQVETWNAALINKYGDDIQTQIYQGTYPGTSIEGWFIRARIRTWNPATYSYSNTLEKI